MLATPDPKSPDGLRPWIPALVSGGNLYLFDTTYGLPIPGPKGQGIATLAQAAAALGTPKWKVIVMITYRAAVQGMLTGVMLGVARISGETAPLLFTALNNQFWSTDMNAPMANLPVVIFQFALSPYKDWQSLAWGGALLITVAILVLNISARLLANWKSFAK